MRIAIQNTVRTGEALRQFRKEKHLTLAEVAQRVGRSIYGIGEIERNGSLSLGVLRRIAKALGFRIEIHFISEE